MSIDMRWRLLLVSTLLVLVLTFSNPPGVTAVEVPDTSDVKVLMIISEYFGWNYWDAREIFQSWGVNVTTVALSNDYDVASCLNKEQRPVTVEYRLQDMTPEMVAQYDCLFVPSGGQWQQLVLSTNAMTFISDAYNMGLMVASICIGTRVVAEANSIVNGSKVTWYTGSAPQMEVAGATLTLGTEAVADEYIITGGSGGGPDGGGNLEAPSSEVCAEVVRKALGLSRITDSSLYPSRGPIGTNFTISAVVNNLNDSLLDILSTDIHEVSAQIYGNGNRTLIDTVELTDDDHDGNYTGYFIGPENGDYVVDLEVEDTNSTLEVVREAEIFEVGLEPTRPIDVVLVSAVTGGGFIIIILVVALIRKK
jgi:putative intracellular protease/amidase